VFANSRETNPHQIPLKNRFLLGKGGDGGLEGGTKRQGLVSPARSAKEVPHAAAIFDLAVTKFGSYFHYVPCKQSASRC
jgi:hypothetical protein